MENNNFPSGNMIPGPGVGFNLQSPIRVAHHHHGSFILPCPHDNFPLRIRPVHEPVPEFIRGEKQPNDEDDDNNNNNSNNNNNNETTRAKNMNMNMNMNINASPWQRVKWNDQMVRLLITVVSYIGEDGSTEYNRRKYCNIQKKGKWKSVSKVMAERGHFVSPQQCEDKFNDLNKRYKRLNEILGRGTSCEVVENPSLLDLMDRVSDKLKEEVRKILSSKHLHYEEMCSYHNGNRLHLPHDPELQNSLRLALGARDDHEDLDDDDDDDVDDDVHDPYMDYHHHDDHDEYDDYHHHGLNLESKRVKQSEDSHLKKNVQMEGVNTNTNLLQDQWMNNRMLQLEEQKIHIQAQMLELEKERFKWQRFRQKKDTELEMMRMDNERMKMENDQIALELKRKALSADLNQ